MVFDNEIKKLNKIDSLYSSKDPSQSFTDILNNFKQISDDYNKFVNDSLSSKFSYSSYIFDQCTDEEKNNFVNDQLQLLECLVINSIYEKTGFIWNFYDIFNLLKDPLYKKTDKISRKVIYSTAYTQRPIGEQAFLMWNGLQIIDLDIKNADLSTKLKDRLFDNLKKYNWFLGICKSASKKSLHIWTKITPLSIETNNRKVEYYCNFRHKYSYIYIVLQKLSEEFGYTKDDIIKFMDMAMCKPQQGIFISSDEEPLMNTNFQDLRLDVNFESAFISGVDSIDWISHPDLKNIFAKLEWFNTERSTDDINSSNVSGINERDVSKDHGKVHYKHAQRWQLANTLTSLYGYDKALQIMKEICKGTPVKELAGDVKTASIHNKPISTWAIKELNKQHGFKLKIDTENHQPEIIEKMSSANSQEDPIKIINDNSRKVEISIKNNQYLSDIKDTIISQLDNITLLEAGAGYGKTEMIKSLNSKTLLILPFTSTIKAKVESDSKTSDWLYYYGTKRPTLADILGKNNMSMTIDKFSRLNVFELNQADFKYIVIDESHLLFTSSYRDVMGPTIQRLANCKAKVIMMTGTPTGELLFFPNIKHIKVVKEDTRIKDFSIFFVPTKYEKMYDMCYAIASDICYKNKKILFPTNNGTLFVEQVTGLVQQFLVEMGYNKSINSFYYKKANYGADSMDKINVEKSIGDNDIVFCTTYLSVGVDICDKYDFNVYFNEPWIAQDIEQFANRLRNNDLYVHLYLEKEDSTGWHIDYNHTHPLDLSISQKDLVVARDLIQTCNDMIDRNREESKYNPLIQSLLASNRYLKYDENDCKYYIDETTYKLRVFEERYSEYSKQLQVLINGMKYYGYTINIIDSDKRMGDDKTEWLDDYLKVCRHTRFDYWTKQTFTFLSHINDGNIDMYKELLMGNYAIFKDDTYKEDREVNNLYVENIEILEKNIPIVLTLYKFYDCETITNIFAHCIDGRSNRINYSQLDRIKRFVIIEANRRKRKIDFPIYKYIKEAQHFAKTHSIVSKEEIEKFIGTYAVKYANSIKDLVVEDNEILEMIYNILVDLWKVVILQKKSKDKTVFIRPFELLWEQKNTLMNIYGTELTKEFFSELVDNMQITKEEEEEPQLPDLAHNEKKSLANIKDALQTTIYTPYNYYEYSELDDSNERFMRKQEKQNSIRDGIFDALEGTSANTAANTEKTLFDI